MNDYIFVTFCDISRTHQDNADNEVSPATSAGRPPTCAGRRPSPSHGVTRLNAFWGKMALRCDGSGMRPSYCPQLLLLPATSWRLIYCVHHTVLCLSYLKPHPGSLYIASIVLSSVAPTSSHILAPDTLRPSYSPLSPLPPATSWLFTHFLHHTVPCLSYLQPHPGS